MSANLVEVTQPTQPPLFMERPDELWDFCGQTFEDHLGCWQEVDGQVQKDKWKLGAIAASLNTKYRGKTIDRFAHDTRRSARTIRDYAQTFRAFQNGGHLPILSFYHHTVASRADDPVDAIQKAHDGEWSSNELEHWIKTGEEPNQGEPKPALKLIPEMQKLHDDAVAAELDGRIAIVNGWTEPVDPVLSIVYRRITELLKWQRDRTIETDCSAIMKMFLGEEGTEGVYTADKGDISAWLYGQGLVIGEQDLTDRLDLLAGDKEKGIVGLRMLAVESREGSRGPEQRGAITTVYATDGGYLSDLDDISRLPTAAARDAAKHENWIARLTRYAPELLPKKKTNEDH